MLTQVHQRLKTTMTEPTFLLNPLTILTQGFRL